MRHLPILAALLLAAGPAAAQTNGNFAPGGIVDGARARLNGAESTAPDGRARPDGAGGQEGRQAATTGSKMVKQGDGGAQPPAKAETPNKP